MAGNDGVYFTASGAESTVATGTHQLQSSHSRPSTPTLSLQKLLPSRYARKPSLIKHDTEMQLEGVLVSGLDAGVDSFNTFALGSTAVSFPFESEESNAPPLLPATPERLSAQNGLKYGSFMPFVSERRSMEYEQLTTQAKFSEWKVPEDLQDYDKDDLFDLLCNRSFDDRPPIEWMKAVEHYLWGSHLPPETNFKQEHIALCLKKAVWKVFNMREEDLPVQCALYWVLNRSFHDDILPVTVLGSASTSFTSQAEFNIFSCRALFGAILHTDGKEAAHVALHGFFPIHIAAENLFPDVVYYLLSWGVHVDQRTLFARKTALHHAVRFEPDDEAERVRQKTLLWVLNTFHASHDVQDVGGNVPLFNAILTEDVELIKLMIDSAPINHMDADGDTHLHVAVELHSDEVVRLLIEKGADPRLVNREGQTPFHLAAKNPVVCLKAMKEECQKQRKEFISTLNHVDALGNTPLDYAALHRQKDTFHYIWDSMQEDLSLSIAPYKVVLRRWIQKVRKPGMQTGLSNLQSTLKNIPKPAAQSIMTRKHAPEADEQMSLYRLLQRRKEVSVPAVTTILDKCIYGDRAVITHILESDKSGCYPPHNPSEHSVVLRQLVKSSYSVWWHPTLRIWVNSKWSRFGQWIMCLFFLLCFFQLLALTTALCLAARPGVTDEALNYYNTPLDGFRGFVEAVMAVMWIVKVGNELQKIVVLKPKIYLQDVFVYFNLSAIIFLLLTAILRATGSRSQWAFAALAYIAYSTLALEYLSLMKWSSTYVHTLFIILNRDLTKFLAIFIVFLIGFSGAFFLALQLDRPATSNTSDYSAVSNSTLFIWDAFYDGIRVMVEGQGVLEYDGRIGWFAVLMYLSFLMLTLIIMLNLLIAQMSDTYAKVQMNARAVATYCRARFMVRYLFILGYLHTRRALSATGRTYTTEVTACSLSARWWRGSSINSNNCCRPIIWSDDDSRQQSGRGAFGRVAGLARSTVDCLFSTDRVALRDDDDEEDTLHDIKEKDTLTAYEMQTMLGKVKKSIKTDLKGLRQEVRSLRLSHSVGRATAVYGK